MWISTNGRKKYGWCFHLFVGITNLYTKKAKTHREDLAQSESFGFGTFLPEEEVRVILAMAIVFPMLICKFYTSTRKR